MTRRGKASVVVAIVLLVEVVVAAGMWDRGGRAVARRVYVTLWKYAPKPAGLEHRPPPERFLPPDERITR
jgi:hypothetical protein